MTNHDLSQLPQIIGYPVTDDNDLQYHQLYKKTTREPGVMRGQHIQKALVSHLRRFTPYVMMEASNARYDVIAYVPDHVYFGKPPNGREEFACWRKYERVYCDLKREAILSEAECEYDECNHKNRFYLWGEETKGEDYLWDEFKDSCKCDRDISCPTWQHCRSIHRKRDDEGRIHIGRGLHLFEVKSEKDTLDRLSYQIPEMMDLADNVWLVLAANHETPQWLPPFIGVIRHNGKYFHLERRADGVRKEPAFYWQALRYYGLTQAEAQKLTTVGDRVHGLYRAWFINSVFHFSGWQNVAHQVVVDMTESLTWLNQLTNKIIQAKAFGTDVQKTINSFFDEMAESEAQEADDA